MIVTVYLPATAPTRPWDGAAPTKPAEVSVLNYPAPIKLCYPVLQDVVVEHGTLLLFLLSLLEWLFFFRLVHVVAVLWFANGIQIVIIFFWQVFDVGYRL